MGRKPCFQNGAVLKPHEAIKLARKRAKLTQDQVGKALGIARASVAQWETAPPNGTQPDPEKWPRLAEIYGCTIDELLRGPAGGINAPNVEEVTPPRFKLPLISWVSAGLKEDAFDPYAPGNAEAWIDFDGPFSPGAVCLRVRGQSMTSSNGTEPTFPDGCFIGVEPDRMPKSGEFAVFRFNNSNEATFKRYVKDGPLELLVALAAGYPVITLSDDAQLVGTVTEKRIITRY